MDNILLSLVFWIILKLYLDVSFLTAFSVCTISMSFGMCAQVPGGLGVFEGFVLYFLPHTLSQKSGILASLILFRVLYFFIPFLLALIYLVFDKLRLHFLEKRNSF